MHKNRKNKRKRYTRAERRAFALRPHPKEKAYYKQDAEEIFIDSWNPAVNDEPFPAPADDEVEIKSHDYYDLMNMST